MPDSTKRAGFTVAPAVYTIGRGARLEIFIYRDPKSLERDMSGLDSASAAPKGMKVSWPSPPTLITSANLAAILLTDDARAAERLSLALTAGPPQSAAGR